MNLKENNYAFIDSQNLNLGIQMYESDKLKIVLSPDKEHCSNLLKQTAKEKIWFMDNLRDKLEYKRKSTA